MTLLLLAFLLFGCASIGCRDKTQQSVDVAVDVAVVRPKVVKFCGACHAVPDPSTFPSRAWRVEVEQGYRFFEMHNRTDLHEPPKNEIISYYQQLAPDKLPFQNYELAIDQPPVQFLRKETFFPSTERNSVVSFLLWRPKAELRGAGLLVCDAVSGKVSRIDPPGQASDSHLLAKISSPVHVEPCDLDRDGQMDLLVADLGSFFPRDHTKGQVVWLRGRRNQSFYEKVILKSQLGRVADVQPGDFDNDGDLDLVVAEFGWQRTGRILLLTQVGKQNDIPQFDTVVIDERHGTIHVPVCDLNADGKLDFVALVSQEYETIDAFLNRGDGTFDRKRIYEAGDPSFGSTGIQLVDLDGDGDLDVVYSNGDSMDTQLLKPYHAVHWLENKGTFPFAHHEISSVPGVNKAIARDLDSDGDLDIVVVAYQPRGMENRSDFRFDALLWLEQRKPGSFVRHVIEHSTEGYMSLEVADFDSDGDLDIAVGRTNSQSESLVTYWMNDRKTRGRARPLGSRNSVNIGTLYE